MQTQGGGRWGRRREKHFGRVVCNAERESRALFRQSILVKKLSSVVASPANSAPPLTAVFVLWIFLHSVPSPFSSTPCLPPSVAGSLPLRRRHPVTFL